MTRAGVPNLDTAKDTKRTSLGARVRKLRLERDWTQQALGSKVGTTKAFISLVELDKVTPSVRTLTRLAQALHTTVQFLLFGKGE